MAGLSASGIGSGIDVGGLVAQLVSAERAPQENRLDIRANKAQTKLSAFGSLKSALSSFQSSLEKLSSTDGYKARKALGGDDEVFTTKLDTTAAAGKYAVEVSSLATRHKIASAAYTDSSATVGTGQLNFSGNGESFSVTITDGQDSLEAIRDAINSAEDNFGISASIVNDQDGAHLVFSADESGKENEITVTATIGAEDTGDLSALTFDPNDVEGSALTQKIAAEDSVLIIDGFTQTSANLEVSGMIEGVTFNLVDARPGETFDFEVELDTDSVKKNVENFVSSYNKLMTTLNSLTSYNAETEVAGPLQGDFTVRSIANRLRQEVGGIIEGLDPAFDSLAEVGITTGDKSVLKLDSSTLDDVISADFDALSKLFGGEDGFATRLKNTVGVFTESGGILDSRTDGLQSQLDRIADKREALDARMLVIEARYAAQFNAMDALVSQLTTTGDYLNQQLANLPGNVKKK